MTTMHRTCAVTMASMLTVTCLLISVAGCSESAPSQSAAKPVDASKVAVATVSFPGGDQQMLAFGPELDMQGIDHQLTIDESGVMTIYVEPANRDAMAAFLKSSAQRHGIKVTYSE